MMLIMSVLQTVFLMNTYALQTPEELWQTNDDQHTLMVGASYEDYEIDSIVTTSQVRGEFSTKTKLYTFDYEYGLTKNFSLGVGTTFVDSQTKYRDTALGEQIDRIKGFTDIAINLKGRHKFKKTHGLHYGLKARVSIEDKVRDEVGANKYESNASNGRHIFTPYVSYVYHKKPWLLGLKIEQDITLTKTISYEKNGTKYNNDESTGDAGTSIAAFYERKLDDGNWAGLLTKYSFFSDFKFKDSKAYDSAARADNFLIQAYGHIKLNERLSLIPKAYYIIFNHTQDADNENIDNIEVKQDNGGSFSFTANLRYSI